MKEDSILESLPVAYARHRIVTGPGGHPIDYTFLAANAEFEKVTGLRRSEIIGKQVTEVLPEIREGEFDWIEAYGRIALEDRKERFTQFSKPLQAWYEVLAYSDGPGTFTTVFTEVTEKKAAEEALHRQNERLGILLDASAQMREHKEIGPLCRTIEEKARELTGLESTAVYTLQGNTLHLQATHPPLPPDAPAALRTCPVGDHPRIQEALAAAGPVFVPDTRAEDLSPAEKEVCEQRDLVSLLFVPLVSGGQSVGVLILGSVGSPCGFREEELRSVQTLGNQAGVTISEIFLWEAQERNLAEIKKANRHLQQARDTIRQRERRIQEILSYAESVSFVQTDVRVDGPRILDFSPGAEKVFGYTKEEVLGKKVEILHRPEDVQRFPQVLEAMRNRQPGFAGETILVRKDGTCFTALFTTHPLFDENGELEGTFGTSIDISRQKKTERLLAESLTNLRRGLEGFVDSMGILMSTRNGWQTWRSPSQTPWDWTRGGPKASAWRPRSMISGRSQSPPRF